ncbi:PadR family transcriptional regulator [Cellulomonas sp. WB94]|uniref:PadR family transcriptional regulator n=1 Tax=Cellulomonas sp. WB94 TaxID=2173174 RepID=UPI0013049FAB|nr:PadR family transcriptional regulator [Cellulomonas sp. WB94]
MIDILVLAVLRNGPAHGYELKRRVERPTLRPLSNNSLYPLLRRFEESGAVTKEVQTTEGRPARNTYAITAQGHVLFHQLITTLAPDQAARDEDFLVRVGFFAEMSADERAGLLAARDAALDVLMERATALLGQVQDPAGWRHRSMGYLLDRLARDRAFVAELREAAALDAGAS